MLVFMVYPMLEWQSNVGVCNLSNIGTIQSNVGIPISIVGTIV